MKTVNGDIFQSTKDAIANPVNVIGISGKGLALQFKENYPNMFLSYKELCDNKLIQVGFPVVLYKDDKIERNVILFPTKKHWMHNSKIEYIQDGLNYLGYKINKNKIKSIAFPLLGCGLGNLNKEDVIPLIEKFEKDFGFDCELYLR